MTRTAEIDKIPENDKGESDIRFRKLMPVPNKNIFQKNSPPLLPRGHS